MQKQTNYMSSAQLSEMSKKRSNKNTKYEIILHDDSTNTFDHVIDCLVDICSHTEMQAHQCALITHNNGQCSIFVDTESECELIYSLLLKNKLSVTMNKYKKK